MSDSYFIVIDKKHNKTWRNVGNLLITNQLLYQLSYKGIVKYIGFYTILGIRANFFVPKKWLKIVGYFYLHSFYIVFLWIVSSSFCQLISCNKCQHCYNQM